MDLSDFMACADEIETMPLPAIDKERRVIRLLDLDRFLKAYTDPLIVKDQLNLPAVIALAGRQHVGIFFMDVSLKSKAGFRIATPDHCKKPKMALTEKLPDELWLVLVSEIALPGVFYPEMLCRSGTTIPNQSFKRVFLLDFHNTILYDVTS